MGLRSSGFAGIVLLMAGACASAQVDLSGWPKVQMDVVGTDAKGDPLQGLTADQVQVRENGHVIAAAELKAAVGPMSICILVDSSGSMYESLGTLRTTLARLIGELPAEDEVCVADFSNDGFIDQNLTMDRKLDLKALTFLKAAGGTALYDMLSHLADYMRKNGKYRSRAIILFSDGADNASSMKLPELRKEWLRPGTPVLHVVSVPEASFMNGSHSKKDPIALSEMGGGFAYFPRKLADFLDTVDHLNEAMKSRYRLTYLSDNESKDGSVRRVDVDLDKPHQKAKAVVRAAQGYYAPSQ